MYKIIVQNRLLPAGQAILDAREDVAYEVVTDVSDASMRKAIRGADGVILGTTPFGDSILEAADRLQVVARFGVGYDAVDVPALTRRSLPLMVTGEANSVSVAEQALFMMLSLAKRGALYDRNVRAGHWQIRSDVLASDLFGRTALVIGFGRIASRLVSRLRAMEMRVIVADPFVPTARIEEVGAEHISDFRTVLGEVDVISLHAPRTPDTYHMIGSKELAAMKPTAWIVNTARGGLIDEAALYDALKNGRLGGAGLDVFEEEPAKPDNPLFELENVIVSPHSAGVSEEAAERMSAAAVENVLSVLDGHPIVDNVINKEVLQRPAR